MEEFFSLLNEDVLVKFLLLFARVVSFVAFMPVFGHTAISVTVRVAFAFYLVIFLFPFIGDVKYIIPDYAIGKFQSKQTYYKI